MLIDGKIRSGEARLVRVDNANDIAHIKSQKRCLEEINLITENTENNKKKVTGISALIWRLLNKNSISDSIMRVESKEAILFFVNSFVKKYVMKTIPNPHIALNNLNVKLLSLIVIAIVSIQVKSGGS